MTTHKKAPVPGEDREAEDIKQIEGVNSTTILQPWRETDWHIRTMKQHGLPTDRKSRQAELKRYRKTTGKGKGSPSRWSVEEIKEYLVWLPENLPAGASPTRGESKQPTPAPKQMALDKEAARAFLAMLAPKATVFTFQTFDDNKDRKDKTLARVITGTLDEVWPQLVALSKQGAGVFVTVNETDGKGRKKENIIRVRAIWQEDDGDGKEIPLTPHIKVESSPGKYHRYIRVVGMDFKQHRTAQGIMVSRYGSDLNAKDVTRVLRLPGTPHQKDPSKPFMVRVVETNERDPYTVSEIFNALGSAPETKPKTTASPTSVLSDEGMAEIESVTKAIHDAGRDMLCRLSHRPAARQLRKFRHFEQAQPDLDDW